MSDWKDAAAEAICKKCHSWWDNNDDRNGLKTIWRKEIREIIESHIKDESTSSTSKTREDVG